MDQDTDDDGLSDGEEVFATLSDNRWVQSPHNQHWYRLGRAQTWYEAAGTAQTLGCDLATIRNQAEQDWAFTTFGPATSAAGDGFYIGLSNFTGTETWSSGEAVTYTNWATGEPSTFPWVAYLGSSQATQPGYWYADYAGLTPRWVLFESIGSTSPTAATDPTRYDSDDDGIGDGTEQGRDSIQWPGDPANGIAGTDSNVFIPDADSATTTDPLDGDSDDDGAQDGVEDRDFDGFRRPNEGDPNSADTDGDGLNDGLEIGLTLPSKDTIFSAFIPDADPSTTTNPVRADTDGGGKKDGVEDSNQNGKFDPGETDPNNPNDDGFNLVVDPIQEGGVATFYVSYGPKKAWLFLCYSETGGGPTSVGSSGLILDLSPPIAVLDPMRLSATGALQIGPVSVPPRVTTGMTIWFQGLAYSMQGSVSESLSNGVMVVVQ
jgi:hypothetical protein